MKLRMAKNSLFAVLLRSPWWISAVIALALGMASFALLPEQFRVVGALSGLPFAVIAALAARQQWRLPSAARVAETHAALGAMAWPAFADLLEQSFRRDGYSVERSEAAGVDFALERKGRRLLVCAGAGSRPAPAWRLAHAASGARSDRRGGCPVHRPGVPHRDRSPLRRRAPHHHLARQRAGACAARPVTKGCGESLNALGYAALRCLVVPFAAPWPGSPSWVRCRRRRPTRRR
jgi:restriction system protein